jgi:DNA mismatch endonuclease (patch repair protein)
MDSVDKQTRSRVMASVHSKGNRSTEKRLRHALIRAKVKGWRTQATDLAGVPDFVFDKEQVAVFVDGCFWHGCPRCYRRPSSSRKYWDKKVKHNKARDKRVTAKLRRSGWSVIRIWEHSLSEPEKAVACIRDKLAVRSK